MSTYSILPNLDAVSQPPLKGKRTSWLGCMASLGLIALCLVIYIPAIKSYFSGNYFQSMYQTNSNFSMPFYSKDDFKLAITIRSKQNGTLYNHAQILNTYQAFLSYDSLTATYRQSLQLCDSQYFANDINGVVLEDCLMIPDYVEYDMAYSSATWSSLSLVIFPLQSTNPIPSTVFIPNQVDIDLANFISDWYVEFYFTSKVITPEGKVKFQLHRAYSTQTNVASDSYGAIFNIIAGLRTTLMDDSIMPWRNNRNVTVISYAGKYEGVSTLDVNAIAKSGVYQKFQITSTLQIAVRFYKKMDWLLGIIGGGIFLLFIIFWVFFNFYNRSMLKIQLANQLLLQKTTDDYPKSEEELIAVKIPAYYMLRRLLPMCEVEKYEKLLLESERFNDITLLIKRMKVTNRNLKKLAILPQHHDSKVIDLPEIEKMNEEESSNGDSSEQQNNHNQLRQQQPQKHPKLHDDSHAHISIIHKNQESNNEEREEQIQSQLQSEPNNENKPIKKTQMKHNAVVEIDLQQQEGLQATGHPLRQQKVEQEEKKEEREQQPAQGLGLMGFDQVELCQEKKEQVPLSQQRFQPKMQQQPVLPEHHEPPHNIPAPIAYIGQNQLLVNAAPNQIIIIGNQQQINQYNNQPAPQPRPQLQPSTLAHSLRDDKFNLTTQQLTFLRTTNDQKVITVFQNNSTFQAMRQDKHHSFADMMELEELDKWEGHFSVKLLKCAKKCRDRFSQFFRALDPFEVRVTLMDNSGSTTCCGVGLTMIIIALSIFTFAHTMANMNQTQFLTEQNYLPINQVSFTRYTDNNFNAVLCIITPGYFLGVSKQASFNFFTTTNGVAQLYTPVQLTNSDPVLNLQNNVRFVPNGLILTNCFRMPHGVPVSIDGTGNSHFGFTFTPYCSSTPSYCNNSHSQTNTNFLNAVTKNPLLFILPGSRLDPNSNSLVTEIFLVPYLNVGFVKMNVNMALEQTAYANLVRLYDDTTSSFKHRAPILQESNINMGYNTRRTYVKAAIASQPSYTFRVRLNQAATDYKITQKKADWILGIIGGVFVFWYAIVHLLGGLYNRFNFNAHIAKLVYEEDSYDASIGKKILAILRINRHFLPRCMDIRRDIDRMKAIDDKMEDSLTHIGLLKYVDNCFRLSSAFFSSLQAKNFSLLYFRQKIFADDQVIVGRPSQKSIDSALAESSMIIDPNERRQNEVANEMELQKFIKGQENLLFNQGELEKQKLKVQHEAERDYIIDAMECTPTNYFDLFEELPSFSFRGQRYFTSVTGGLCCFLMVLFTILVVVYQIALYLNNDGVTTSYDLFMDDGMNSTGITLTTGSNFKLAISFMDAVTLQAVDPSAYLPYVGVSLLQQKFTRTNNTVVPNITSIDLVPCASGYIQSWIPPNVDSSYFSNLNKAYCAPNGLSLQIYGFPQSQTFSSFKVSIYNKVGNSSGLANLTKLLNTTYPMLYFSSPRQNSISRVVQYQMQSLLFSGLTALTPFQTNMTLSKSNVTYDDNRDGQNNPLNLLTYRFQPYNQEWLGYQYYGQPTSNLWFNISFSYTHKVHTYNITAPKFYEVFGIIGGVIAFFYFIIAIFIRPFNNYKLRYEIGKEIYLFDKRRIKENQKKVKMKLRKSTSQRKRIQKMNDMSELSVLEAFILSPIGRFTGNYNFNESLRIVTLIQDRVTRDIDISQLYLSLYRTRDAIAKKLASDIQPPVKLQDIFFKKIANPYPREYTIQRMRNYAKAHRLSSYEQMVVYRAVQAKVELKGILDGKFMEDVFNVVDVGGSARLDMMNDTMGSITSSATSSLNESVAEDV